MISSAPVMTYEAIIATLPPEQAQVIQAKLAASEAENQLYLDELDFIARIVQINTTRMTPQDKILYISTIETYPLYLLKDTPEPVPQFSVKRIREAAGGASKNAAGNFMRGMAEAGAWDYDSGSWDGEDRLAEVTPHALFTMPEDINLKSAAARKAAKERAAEEAARLRQNLLLDSCEECASPELLYDLIPHCPSCEHVHEAIRNVPASAIKVVEEVEVEDQFSRLLSGQAPACQPAPTGAIVDATPIETIQTDFITFAPAAQAIPEPALCEHPHGAFCPDCGEPNAWRPIPTTYGTYLYVCAICYPASPPGEGNLL